MWPLIEKVFKKYFTYLPWQMKYFFGKAGIGGIDLSIDRHFEYAFVISRLSTKKKGLLLEIGGSGSLLTPILVALGHQVIGYDLHPWSLIYPGYEHRVGDAQTMQLEDSTVDICVSISCIEHMENSRYGLQSGGSDKAVLKEIFRILKPGGFLIFSVPYGIAKSFSLHHVYDEQQIKDLTKNFIECSREIYVPVSEKSLFHYRKGNENEAKLKRPWYRYSVIALEIQKPYELPKI